MQYIFIICHTFTIPTLFRSKTIEEKTDNISVTLYGSVNLVDSGDHETFQWYEWTTNATRWHCSNNLHICYIENEPLVMYKPNECTFIYLNIINCTKSNLYIDNVTAQTPLQYTLNKAGVTSEIAQRHNFSLKLIYPTTSSPITQLSATHTLTHTSHATGTAHAEARRQSESTNNVVTPVMVVFGGAALVGIGYLYGRKPKIPLLNAF
ncbi:Ba12 [Baboon cytomegalovirus]|nr:Ba12 [Baboon cytomegalovirus]